MSKGPGKMQLDFTSEADIRDSELVIRLDLDGLSALLRALAAAMESGQPHSMPGARSATGSPNAFGMVTLTFVQPRRDRPSEPAPARPAPGLAEAVPATH
jgi:hypothetical protein